MKNYLIVSLLLISSLAFSQKQELAMANHIFISIGKKKINLGNISKKSIISLLGTPQRIKKEMSETDGLLTIYRYAAGEIDFDENGYLNSIEIKSPEWAMILKTKKKPEKSFSFDSTSKDLYTYFEKNWNGKDPGAIDIHLLLSSGETDPYTWIDFRTSKGHISSILYAFNNF